MIRTTFLFFPLLPPSPDLFDRKRSSRIETRDAWHFTWIVILLFAVFRETASAFEVDWQEVETQKSKVVTQ